jgi:hypothetical protein
VCCTHQVYICLEHGVFCLLALKHLVSLQAHTRPSVQAELDLRSLQQIEKANRGHKRHTDELNEQKMSLATKISVASGID